MKYMSNDTYAHFVTLNKHTYPPSPSKITSCPKTKVYGPSLAVVRGLAIDTHGVLKRRLVLPEDCDDIIHFVQGLKEWDKIKELSIIGIIKPWRHWDLRESKNTEVKQGSVSHCKFYIQDVGCW